jgi:hypothetical protein
MAHFKPSGNVTYAEALKMVLCALGYTEDLIKPIYWPVTWIAKAVNVGLTKGVDVSPNLAAPRGQIAALLENSLTIDKVVQTGYGDKVEYIVKAGETFLKGLAGAEPIVGHLFDSPELFANDGKSIKVEATGNPTFKLLNAEDVKGLLGHRVKVWVNASNEVLFVEDLTPADSVKSASYVDEDTIEIDDKDKDIDWSKVRLYRNCEEVVAVDDKEVLDGEELTAIYHDDNLYAVVAFDYETGVVDTVSTLYRRIRFAPTGSLVLDEDAEVTYIGDASKLSEIKKNDVVEYFVSSDALNLVIVVTREAHTGKFTKLASGKATIGGTVFSPATSGLFDPGDIGETVTVLLNKDGKVVKYFAETATVAKNIAMVTGKAGPIPTIDGIQYWVKLLLADGTKANFQTTESIFDDVYSATVVEYTLDDGEIDSVTELIDATDPAVPLKVAKNYKLVGGKVVASDTAVFTYKSGKFGVATWEDLAVNKEIDGILYADGNKAVAIVMTSGEAAAEGTVYGVIAGKYKELIGTEVKDIVKVLLDGVVTDYQLATGSSAIDDLVAKKVVKVTVFGASAKIELVTDKIHQASTGKTLRVTDIDEMFITVGEYDSEGFVSDTDELYVVNEDTQYVNCTGSTPKALGLLSVEDKVVVYYDLLDETDTRVAKVITVIK